MEEGLSAYIRRFPAVGRRSGVLMGNAIDEGRLGELAKSTVMVRLVLTQTPAPRRRPGRGIRDRTVPPAQSEGPLHWYRLVLLGLSIGVSTFLIRLVPPMDSPQPLNLKVWGWSE